jgi:hypothetical protein
MLLVRLEYVILVSCALSRRPLVIAGELEGSRRDCNTIEKQRRG